VVGDSKHNTGWQNELCKFLKRMEASESIIRKKGRRVNGRISRGVSKSEGEGERFCEDLGESKGKPRGEGREVEEERSVRLTFIKSPSDTVK